ncbi:MAG: iron ABC transporter permease [Prevotella sp.]|nr:iron ABC transporter permease [Prevotella sp.]
MSLLIGSVSIPASQVVAALTGGEVERESWRYIILESRLPQTVTAMLCGASLAASGLMLQTAFRNPLAGPSILGITNGASLGVAIVMLVTGGTLTLQVSDVGMFLAGSLAVVVSAFIGAVAVIALLLLASTIVSSNLMLLIVGIMISYLVSSVVSMVHTIANADNIQSYVLWGMGSFNNVTLEQLPLFTALTLVGLLQAVLLIKPLNALMLGDEYARNLGVNVRRVRRWLLLSTGLLTGISTAYCGPVAFIGLAVPHIARLMMRTADHLTLMPVTIVMGAVVALLCNVISVLPQHSVLPLNAVTPLFGAPVIIYIILKRN